MVDSGLGFACLGLTVGCPGDDPGSRTPRHSRSSLVRLCEGVAMREGRT